MKKISAPDFDDFEALDRMCENSKLSSYPVLRDRKGEFVSQYERYILVEGDAFRLNPSIRMTDHLKASLISHYYGEIKGLEVIEHIRNKLSPVVCPMCGGKHPTTVDHFIPKDKYPEYSVFTRNLVPACSCNSKRGGNDYKGDVDGKRVLHPYFDRELSEMRLITTELDPPFESPNIRLVVCRNGDYIDSAAQYHLDNVIKKTNVINVMEQEWRNLVRFYKFEFDVDAGSNIDAYFVRGKLAKMLMKEDSVNETPNNWSSMLLSGVLNNPDAINFLVDKFSRFESGLDDPECF